MGSNPYSYTVTLDTPIPAVISLPEINWSGNLVNLFNGIPSSSYNSVVYPVEKAAFAAHGYDLTSVTDSHWINDNGKLAFTFNTVVDPVSDQEAAVIIAAEAGALVAALMELMMGGIWGLVVGYLAGMATFNFIYVNVFGNGPIGTGTPTSTSTSTTSTSSTSTSTQTPTGGSAGSSCTATSQCAQGLVCQNGTCTQCNGIIVGSTCVPTWALIAGVGIIALTGVAIAMAKK